MVLIDIGNESNGAIEAGAIGGDRPDQAPRRLLGLPAPGTPTDPATVCEDSRP